MNKRMPVDGSVSVWMQQIWAEARLRRGVVQAAGALGALAPVLALANPTGGQVVAGTATIGTAGNGVIINQGSQRAAINWQQFSVGSNEYVQFNQPNSSSVVLNRVIGSNPSGIFGQIHANGQVFLINPNGILFAPGSSLDVSGLTASTLDISDADFMAGRYVFSRAPGSSAATVVNQGNLQVSAGGYVVLAGDYVENDGVINAVSGRVVLAAGGAATLSLGDAGDLISYKIDAATLARLAGVDNAGSIVANGGSVVMTADVANALTATAVNNSGLITAHSVRQQGGEIMLLSQGGDIENSGTLDASATQVGVAGGNVILHGDAHTQLTDTSVIDAEGDVAKGGFIELSGHTLGVRGAITAGKGGDLLIDPSRITIVAGNVNGAGTAGTNSVGTTFIVGKLNNGSNVAIVASSEIDHIAGTGITATTGAGNLTIEIGTVSCPTGICVGGSPTITPGQGVIDIIGLPIDIKGNLVVRAAGAASAGGQISTDNLKAASISLIADKIVVNGNLTTTVGDAILFGHSGNSDSAKVTGTVNVAGAFKASFSNEGGFGIGTVTLHQVTAEGISVMASHIIDTTGTLTATGSVLAAGSHRDVVLKSEHEFTSAGGASINVGNIISDNGGVTLTASGNGASVGNITVAGTITGALSVTITADGSIAGEGAVNVAGLISAGRGVTIQAPQITTVAINAGGSVDLEASGNLTHASITVHGAIHGRSGVSLDASGSYGGEVKVTGAIVSTNGGVSIKADNTRAISGGGISVGSISADGNVTIFSRGGGAGSHSLSIGKITAVGKASIDVQISGNIAPVAVQTGAISAGAIKIRVEGHQAKFTAPSLKATGASSVATSCECIPTHNGFISGVVGASSASASFNVAGSVKSLNGSVDISAGHGAIDTGTIGAGTSVVLKGNNINVGNITAGGSVSLVARNSSGSPVSIKTGTIGASNGKVLIQTKGNGGISVDTVTAQGAVSISASNQSGAGAFIKVNGGISASAIDLFTSGSRDGNITVTGGLTARTGNIDVSASMGSGGNGGNISVGGVIKASNGSVSLFAEGGGNIGGNITVGKVTAGLGVSIDGIFLGSAEAGTNRVQTGNITGQFVDVEATGPQSAIQTDTITANGSSSGGEGGPHAYIHVILHPTATAGQGSISIEGLAKSSHGDISIDANGGAVNTVAISADGSGDVDVSGSTINVAGGISALGGSVCLTGQQAASHSTAITVTGTIKSGMVQVTANPSSSATHGASINLAKVVSSLSGGIMIQAKTGAAVNTRITVGSIVATNAGHVDITQQGSSGGITVSGPINISHASVDITATGGSVDVGAITAVDGGISITADGATGGGISVGGDLHGSNVTLSATGHSGANIKVTGKIIASDSVTLNASAGIQSGGNIKVTSLISASNGQINVTAHGGGESGGRIHLGSMSAAEGVTIAGTYTGNSPGFVVKVGQVTAETISITATGRDPLLSAAVLHATGPSGHSCECGSGYVRAKLVPGSSLSGSIHITGTVKSNHGSVSFDAAQGSVTLANGAAGKITAGTDITISGGTLHLGSLSAGSSLQLTASNTGRADSVVVHGNVSATHVRMDAIGSGTGGDITLTGNIFAGTNTSSSAQHGVLLNATNAGTGGGDITVNGKIIASSGSISLNANGGGDIKVTGSMSASNGAVKVTANGGGVNGGRVQLGNIAASNSISIDDAYTGTAPGGATVGNLDASTVTVVLTQGNLTIGQLVKPGATIKASNGSITDSVTGNLDLSGETLQAFDGVHLKATGNITLNSTSFGGSAFSASAGGNIVEASANPLILSGQVLKAGHLLVLSAGTIDLGAAKLTASSIQLSATSINNASGNGSITAAKGTIHATHGIFLANENIVVSGAGPLISAASVDLDDAVVSGTGVLSIKTSGDLQASDLTVTAAGLKITAGHDADLSGAHINSTKVSINAVHDVNISGAQVVGSAVGISAGSILNGSAPGKIIAGKGGLTLKSKGDMQLAGETLNIAGTGLISAAGNLDLAGAKLSGVGPTTLHAGTDVMLTGATLTLSMTVDAAGGSIDLTGATANVSALALQAKKDIILSGVHINAGVFTASASGTIHNGGAQGAITANAIKVDAKQDIDLSSTVITLGSGALTGVTGDTILLQLLAAAGLKPASAAPNGAFMAGGSLTLGALNITGNYLVLQGSSIAILGPVTAPAKGLVVEVRPTDPAASIGVEGQLGTGQSFNISNQGFFALFPGDTIVVGDDAESGNVFIGANGPFTLAGGTNLLFDTTGSITGLDKITSTGLVGSLETIAAAASDNNIVTAGEIDPSTTSTSLGDQTDKKRLGSGQNDPNGEGAGGTISQDSGTSSVCH